ncbi:Uncharacterised protein [Vibrio cholerae]|nr:Uncharacterised protein [Vibrio cholerae]
METTEQAADGFNSKTKVVTNITTCHGETKLSWAETALRETSRKVVQEGR